MPRKTEVGVILAVLDLPDVPLAALKFFYSFPRISVLRCESDIQNVDVIGM